MRIAISPPTQALHLTPITGLQLCLAEYILTDNIYSDFYISTPTSEIIILDTMVHERKGEGQPISFDDLMEAHYKVSADVIVVPDDDHDPKATLARLKEWAPKFRDVDPEVRIMGVVPRAQDLDTWVLNLRDTYSLVDVIGLPMETEAMKGLNIDIGGGRLQLLAICDWILPRDKQIHLLGIRQDLAEIRIAAGFQRLLGADTARPVTLALQGVLWEDVEGSLRLPGKQPDFFDTPYNVIQEHKELICQNIQYLLEAAHSTS